MSSGTAMSSSASGALRLAEEYLVRGDVREALSIYRMISETDPSNLSVKARFGELLALAHKNSDAIRVLAEAATGYSRQGRQVEAVDVLNKALALKPSDPDALMILAPACSRCGLDAEAERCYMGAAGVYERAGETAKVISAYEGAAAAAPGNAELQMKLGSACHRSGKLEDSYRAFMRAAAEFKNRGDDCAALDAYGRAVKAALSGAEAGEGVTETLSESGVADAITRIVPGSSLHQIQAPPFLELISRAESGAAPGRLAVAQRTKDDSTSKDESSDDDPVAGKIATAEILFELGSCDRAIALLKELLDTKPEDPRIHRKLTDLYIRSDKPHEAAAVYRELARVYMTQGNPEIATDCMSSARQLSGPGQEQALATSSLMASEQPESTAIGWTSIIGQTLSRVAGQRTSHFGVEHEDAAIHRQKSGKSRYWVAIAVLVLLGMAGAYLAIHNSQSASGRETLAAISQQDPTPAESPAVEVEAQTGPADAADGSEDHTSNRSASTPQVQKQNQPTREQRTSPQAADVAPAAQPVALAKPTPPPVGVIGAPAASGSSGGNAAPGTLATEIPPAPPPPTPRPSLRKAAVMGGGDVLRRVQPIYPPAARTAHITGTVTVELAINEEGSVVSARATTGPGLLTGAAESAARGFKFKPITLDGVAVKANRTILFHFKE